MERIIHLGAGTHLTIKRHATGTWTLHQAAPGREDIYVHLADDDQARKKITWLLAGAMHPQITLH
ncbi:hypothetical protein [Saccharopolyspora shandongensis]|uniref:hypothetical protein n=1 Tax=Saccharopolyspora shandongensis TaxID=418495 RepID=UPI0033E6AC3C